MLNKILPIALLLNFLLLATGCAVKSKPAETPEEEASELSKQKEIENTSVKILESASVKPVQKTQMRSSATKRWEMLHTQLDLYPDLQKQEMEASAWLWLKPYYYPQKTLQLDAKYIDVQEVWLCEFPIKERYVQPRRKRQILDFDKTPLRLNLKFPDSVREDRILCLEIKYTVRPKTVPGGGSDAIRNRIGLYFLKPDNYHPSRPTQLWTQGEPESASFWFPCLDAPNQKSTQVLRMHFPDSMVGLSNGRMIHSESAHQVKTQIWSTNRPQSPYLFMMAIGDWYQEHEKVYGLDYYYLVDRPYLPVAKSNFRQTPQMVSYFSQYFGYSFPWQKYAQVVVHDFVSGAMENTSAVTFSSLFQKNERELVDGNNDNVVAHELSHHWFGDLATMESWRDITLSESFATLGSILWQEEAHGAMAGQQNRYSTFENYVSRSYPEEPPLIRDEYDTPGEVFDHISYQKGASILYYLRDLIGEDAFQRALEDYLRRHAFQSAEVADWRQSLERVTGEDFQPFFADWYRSSGVPSLRVWQEHIDSANMVRTFVERVDSGGDFLKIKTKLGIYTDSNYTEKDITIDETLQHFDAKRGVGTTLPVLDPHHSLPARIQREYSDDYWRALAKRSPHFEDVLCAIIHLAKNPENFQNQRSLERLVHHDNDYIAQTAAQHLNVKNLTIEAQEQIMSMIGNDWVNSGLRVQLIDRMAVPRDAKNESWLRPLCYDTSYLVSAHAIWFLDSLDHDYALQLCLDSVHTAKSQLYKAMLAILSASRDSRVLPALEKEIKWHYGRAVFTPLFYVRNYAMQSADSTTLEPAIALLAYRGRHDDLAATREFAVEKMYEVYVDQYRKSNIEQAQLVRNKIEETLDSWTDTQRRDEFGASLDWEVKIH